MRCFRCGLPTRDPLSLESRQRRPFAEFDLRRGGSTRGASALRLSQEAKKSRAMTVLRYALSKFAWAYVATGSAVLLMTSASIVGTLSSPPSVWFASSGSAETNVYPEIASNGPEPIFPWGVTLGIECLAPPTIVGQGLHVTARFTVNKVTDQAGGELSPVANPGAFAEIRRHLVRYLQSELSIAGVTVAPTGYTPVDRDLTANWSIRGIDDGEFIGLVKTILAPPRPATSAVGSVLVPSESLFGIPGDLALKITVRPRPWTANDYGSLCLGVLGAIVTFGGVFGLFWTWQDRQKKKREESEKDTPPLYSASGERIDRR